MCYEERYFSEWAARAQRKREAQKPVVEQRRPTRPPEAPKPAKDEPREAERELEPV